MARRRRRRLPTPGVLRRAYGGCVKTLESIILSLLPSPPPDSPLNCSCNGRLCLGCMGESHLLSEADPAEYLRFLTHSFCFLSPFAPPPPVNFSAAGLGLSHESDLLGVRATCTHVWDLLLERIGDELMAFLLHYSSIFVPLANDNYLQVTGESLEGMKFQISVRPPCRQLKCNKESEVANVLRVLPKKRRPHAPIIFKRLYGCQVNTFKSIILSLLPKTLQNSSLDCHCKGRICLGCLGVSYLIQPGDPKDYVRLLLCSYCFLPFDAPVPPCNFLASGLTLGLIVRDVIEFLLSHPKFHKNVLCTGKQSVFFSAVAVTNTNAWDLLLRRIGDELMTFLLKYSAIFICPTDKFWQQIAGNPLKKGLSNDIILSSLKMEKVGDFHSSKLLEVPADSALRSSCNDVSESSSSSRKRRREFSWQRRRKHKKLVEAAKTMPGSEWHAEYHVKDETSVKMSKSGFVKDKFLAGEDILQEQSVKKKVPCFNCVVLHSPSKVEMRTQIKRKLMFYTRHSSHSLFPRQHILNRLKPTNSGAISLLNHIFGVSANDTGSQSQMLCSCLNSTTSEVLRSCVNTSKSKCLFHLLASLFKSLIRNSQRCQYKKLLCKHCVNPALKKNSTVGDGFVPEYGLIDSYSTHQQVVSFVWAVTRSLVPKDLLGDYISWRALRKNISKFVMLRRFENFSVKQCLHGIKASHYPILSKVTFSHQSCCEIGRNVQINERAKKYLRLSCDGKLSLQNKLFKRWIYWYFSYLVVPLLGNHFYITERESERQKVFYYSMPIWKKLFKGTFALLQDKNYSILDHASLGRILRERKSSLGRNTFGFSRVRFLPKEKNLRTIVNLKAPSKFLFTGKKNAQMHVGAAQEPRKFICFKSANSALRELHVVLRRIKAEDPIKFGASVFDYNDMYQRLYQFICGVRKGSAVFPKLYIVVADISNAYDSIDQDLLTSIMNDVIRQDSYCLRNISRIVCTKKFIKVMPDQLCCDQVNMNQDAVKIEASLQPSSSHSILIDKGTGVEVNKQMLHRLLTEHVKHNILQIGHNYYLQEVGIPQGSILSALLCSFYYAHLERNVLLPFLDKAFEISAKDGQTELSIGANENCGYKLAQKDCDNNCIAVHMSGTATSNSNRSDFKCFEEKHWNMNNYVAGASAGWIKIDSSFNPQNLLLRFIDDFLFISTSKQQAASFFTRLQRGFRSYNCYMNYEKFGLNFDVEEPLPSKRCYPGADGMQFIPWSGLLINCENLEIQADYTRYWGIHVSSTITVQAYAKPGCTLGKKLCYYMRPKCHPLLYDSNINSLATVTLNAYQAFLLCAMKFHCCVRSMPSIGKLHPSYILGKILYSFRYMYTLLKKRMHNMEIRFNMKPILNLKKVEMLWLGLSAYIRVLKKKQSRYRELIYLLRMKIAEHGVHDTSPHLRYAVDDSHSSVFWKIQY